ncbi:MAG TPA: Ppx/GppA family phosphatase [Candidatus Stercoripulliclostridium merdipullorum]|uniref:Ppx/GppA family phosphatase n=1 Tax=Candidatus Stercoripulliclostridium merdipullorum TaxID=2840952 RepID=A0A9D1NBC7_9FIRM|nr:Ppx/GppA family phosphatase [Candidatus Stercoripulliclostridium merdipullorum]
MEKIAIIDLGSNSARLVIANILDGGYFVVVDELKEPVRLAQDMEIDGFLRPLRVAQTIKTLRTFRTLYESHGVDKVFAYATAAVRHAKNQKSFVDEVQTSCGIKLTVLSQEEEAMFVYQGVINSMDVPKGLIVDIGGGSVKMIYYNRRVLIAQDTLPFGAVTLSEKFAKSGTPEERADAIERYVTEHLQKLDWLRNLDPETQLIGVGGSIRNLGRISRRLKKYPLDMAHNYHIPFSEFDTIYDTIKPLEFDKTSRIRGLSSARADIFPAALSTIAAIRNYTEFSEIIIGGAGLREGAMFRYSCPTVAEKPISDILGHSIYTLLHHFNANIAHAEHVFDISMQLFRQLKVLHKLPRPYVKILRVASMLHDIGSALKFYDHHKHSMYVIWNSNLYGIPQKDLVVAGIVAACHAKDGFETLDLGRYASMLTEEDFDAIKKLGVIVRIAECFDRSCGGVITGLSCDVLGDSVILKTKTNGDCTLEIKDAMGALPEFRKAFRKNLEIL